ncbi:unnamed protein product [Enterobius vermicularis]|uniref:Uncharacterized protein n=1 Tax=Enterobius vermicularis TaxID=51028 RepID=A0A0N4VNI7_ENTVE|nr:unnamed protein product [Enterobius vermicularis]
MFFPRPPMTTGYNGNLKRLRAQQPSYIASIASYPECCGAAVVQGCDGGFVPIGSCIRKAGVGMRYAYLKRTLAGQSDSDGCLATQNAWVLCRLKSIRLS